MLIPNLFWAQLQVFELFQDNAILQRETEIPLWGWDAVGSEVTILFNGKTYPTETDTLGKWKVELPPTVAGGPFEITISNQDEKIELKNIYFGDVWLCSGQSNMEWTVQQLNLSEDSLSTFSDPLIRHCKVERGFAYTPENNLACGNWESMNSKTVERFTAVGSYFAQSLRPDIKLPIGLLNSSWGGSRIEPWMSAASLGEENADVEEIEKMKAELENEIFKITGEQLPNKDFGIKSGKALWAQTDYNDSRWPQMVLPQLWESAGLKSLDGILWFRYHFNLSENEAKEGVLLSLGAIDDNEQTYVNGTLIGKTEGYNIPREYSIPDSLLNPGKNVITVRAHDTGGGGGFGGEPKEMFIKTNAGQYSIAGNWRYRIGKGTVGFGSNQVPIILYNKMIHPLLDFPIAGVLWYQGESNANKVGATEYRGLFQTMILDWRKKWKINELPFFWVSLANFRKAPKDANQPSNWAVLRESQTAALELPFTAEALAIDVGEADDIHPKDKKTVGKRLGLAARNIVYGQKSVRYKNPTFKSAEFTGNRIIISFNDTADGLIAKNKYRYVNGFAVADEQGVFKWAKAKIVNDHQIEVTALDILKPTRVRYGWADNPDDLDLYNSDGLPVTPFRYDQ